MGSTFMGLETNKRGLYTQQSALYTTGHNISNANTLGYSRQRVNMEATAGFPGTGMNAGTMPGFLGTGVQASSIQRIRDSFVDQQYRGESNKLGYWESRSSAISQMEDVLAEPSAYGLQKSLSEFWSSLQGLATNPENGGARAVVVERAKSVADSFNYMNKSLTEIQTNLGKEIDFSATDINSVLKQVADLNRQIAEVEPNGYMPNDLYDARDMLLDKLSSYLPIEVKNVPTGGRALAIAEGTVTVSLKMEDGTRIELVNGREFGKLETNPSSLVASDNTNLPITGMKITDASGTAKDYGHSEFSDIGKLKSLMNSYGTSDGTSAAKGIYPDMIAELNKMAKSFIEEFNNVHKGGHPLPTSSRVDDFFGGDGAATIKVNQDIIDDPGKINASDAINEVGNGKNAKALSDVQFKAMTMLNGSTIQTYFSGIVGKLGVDGEQASKLTFNTATLLGAVSNRRDSISSVSLDEEMTDMIRFQQAYNASARMITVVDETLDKIINGMGTGGR